MWPLSTHKALSSVVSPAEAGSTTWLYPQRKVVDEKWHECGWNWQCHCVLGAAVTVGSGMSVAETGSVTVCWVQQSLLEALFFELSTKYLKSGSEIKSCPSTRGQSRNLRRTACYFEQQREWMFYGSYEVLSTVLWWGGRGGGCGGSKGS